MPKASSRTLYSNTTLSNTTSGRPPGALTMSKKKKSKDFIMPHLPGRQSVGYQLWEASNAWQRAMRQALLPLDLTHVQYLLMSIMLHYSLENDGSPMSQMHLVKVAGTDKMMTSKVVRMLESRGLVTREVLSHDMRSLNLDLTEEGDDLVRKAAVIVQEVEDAFFLPVVPKIDKLSRHLLSLCDGSVVQD